MNQAKTLALFVMECDVDGRRVRCNQCQAVEEEEKRNSEYQGPSSGGTKGEAFVGSWR